MGKPTCALTFPPADIVNIHVPGKWRARVDFQGRAGEEVQVPRDSRRTDHRLHREILRGRAQTSRPGSGRESDQSASGHVGPPGSRLGIRFGAKALDRTKIFRDFRAPGHARNRNRGVEDQGRANLSLFRRIRRNFLSLSFAFFLRDGSGDEKPSGMTTCSDRLHGFMYIILEVIQNCILRMIYNLIHFESLSMFFPKYLCLLATVKML